MATTAASDVFQRDLERMNNAFARLGAIIATGGVTCIDPTKAPPGLVRAYKRLLCYGAANGLI